MPQLPLLAFLREHGGPGRLPDAPHLYVSTDDLQDQHLLDKGLHLPQALAARARTRAALPTAQRRAQTAPVHLPARVCACGRRCAP